MTISGGFASKQAALFVPFSWSSGVFSGLNVVHVLVHVGWLPIQFSFQTSLCLHVCTNLPYTFLSGWNFTVAAIPVARAPCSNKHFHSHSTFHWRAWTLREKPISLAKTCYVSSCLSNVSKFIFLTTVKSAVFLRIVWPTEPDLETIYRLRNPFQALVLIG